MADLLIIEGDSATIILWIRDAIMTTLSHSVICDIVLILHGCSSMLISHIYREANTEADWMAFYVANNSIIVLWTHLSLSSPAFRDIVFSNFF